MLADFAVAAAAAAAAAAAKRHPGRLERGVEEAEIARRRRRALASSSASSASSSRCVAAADNRARRRRGRRRRGPPRAGRLQRKRGMATREGWGLGVSSRRGCAQRFAQQWLPPGALCPCRTPPSLPTQKAARGAAHARRRAGDGAAQPLGAVREAPPADAAEGFSHRLDAADAEEGCARRFSGGRKGGRVSRKEQEDESGEGRGGVGEKRKGGGREGSRWEQQRKRGLPPA